MLTLFSCPKGFDNPHTNIIQRNAIESWIRLPIDKDIILCGDDPGVADICKEYSLIHISDIKTNEFGTPLLNDVFNKAEGFSNNKLMCYINCDIITREDFAETVRLIHSKMSRLGRFVATGLRWDVDIACRINYDTEWDVLLENAVECRKTAMDYFIYPVRTFSHMPGFAVGRWHWDNWLPFSVLARNGRFIDLTPSIHVFHQNHTYSQLDIAKTKMLTDRESALNSPEGERNLSLCGGYFNSRNLNDVNYVLSDKTLKCNLKNQLKNFLTNLKIKSESRWFFLVFLKPFSVILNRLAILYWKIFYKTSFFD